MRFLNLLELTPHGFMRCLADTTDIELLSKIQKLMLETKEYFADGIPKYDPKQRKDLLKECIEAKKELLSILLFEYQLRLCEQPSGKMHLAEKCKVTSKISEAAASAEYKAARALHNHFVGVYLDVQDCLENMGSPDKPIEPKHRKQAQRVHERLNKFADEFSKYLDKID